ncbi:signal recognition particle subunit SRP68 [Anabrus simplex]|uniref:signal recognition particle subunit SRP68 n=1 Tax=Anabrus simplex TaxID=316456 RepID=UPI0034DCDB86
MVVQEEVSIETNIENSDEIVTTKVENQPVFTVEILKIIKEAQQQHGLRHGDYQRYRGYCTRRIRRLRKVLHITQGDKRHFKRKDITETMVKDERFLYIPLMMAERAWGYAMQLRQEANTEPRKKFHLVSRLRKATSYSLQLQKLCESSKFDARTKLEAQAYVAWIHGSLHFELQLWKPAMENLKKAQMVYEKLAPALPEEDQILYRQRVDELSPSLRYCAYNIGDESAIDDLLQMRGHGQGDLLANLDSLIVQTRERRAEVLCEVEWRGRTFAVRPERVRLFLLSEQELDAAVERAVDSAAKITLFENFLMDCKDAISAVKDELKSDQSGKSRAGTGGPVSSIQYLLSYLTYIRLTRTIQRNLLMVEAAKSALADKNENPTEGRKARPQDLTRLYEIILQNVGELQQLPGLEDDNQYQLELETKTTFYKAFRCFFIAQSLVTLRRWHDAVAMYQRAGQYVDEALNGKYLDASMKNDLLSLKKDIEGQEFSAHAHSVLEGENQEEDGGLIIGPKSNVRAKKPLSERLSEYREDPSLTSRSPNVYRLPPEMKPIPCKPLFFDLAFNFVEFPSLEDKLEASAAGGKKAAGLTGFVKGLMGWGGSAKK